MSTSKQSYKSGDIFNFEIADNEYGFGRVILDIYPQCLKPGLIDQQSLLLNGNEESIFIELFEKTSTNPELEIDTKKVLVPGLFTSNFEIEDNYWKVIGNEPIDPTKIDFPEFLTHEGASQGKFIKGELSTIIDISYEDVEAIKIYANEFAVFSIPDIVLFALGRKRGCVEALFLCRVNFVLRDASDSSMYTSCCRAKTCLLICIGWIEQRQFAGLRVSG